MVPAKGEDAIFRVKNLQCLFSFINSLYFTINFFLIKGKLSAIRISFYFSMAR